MAATAMQEEHQMMEEEEDAVIATPITKLEVSLSRARVRITLSLTNASCCGSSQWVSLQSISRNCKRQGFTRVRLLRLHQRSS
jgi:hypothetical protein